MAKLWTVIVLSLIPCGFAEICMDLGAIKNCNDCLRCGAVWCKKPDNGVHCAEPSDDWCPLDKIIPLVLDSTSTSGSSITPKFEEKSLTIGQSSEIIIEYLEKPLEPEPKVKVAIVESTVKGFRDLLQVSGQLDGNVCKGRVEKKCVLVKVTPNIGFCPANGTDKEQVTLSIKIEGVPEEATARLHIPCACSYEVVERDSMKCNARGDYTSIESCSCHDGWEGEFCETKISYTLSTSPAKGVKIPFPSFPPSNGDDPECIDRGDYTQCKHPLTNLICSNNGRCCDGGCQCDQSLPGYQEFDEYCADMCTASSTCDSCLLNPKAGEKCRDCPFPLIMDAPDKSVVRNSIQYAWSACNITTEGCYIDYAVMRDKIRDMHVMVFSSNCGEAEQYVLKVTVPIVVSVLAVVALLSVAAFMVYKHRLPGLPTSGPQYADIHAEDSTGINPLYKPPTSSFKNPTYGSKW